MQYSNLHQIETFYSRIINCNVPLFEVLDLGEGCIDDSSIRKVAYKTIFDSFPDSTPLLAICCYAFQYEKFKHRGEICPVIKLDNTVLRGSFFINMNDFNNYEEELSEIVQKIMNSDTMPAFKLPENKDVFFRTPDFTKLVIIKISFA
jgi:hypothetical protein